MFFIAKMAIFVIIVGGALAFVACKKDCDGGCPKGYHCDGTECVKDDVVTPPPPSICPGCGHEYGHCMPGCTHGTNCICIDTVNHDVHVTITLTNMDQLRAVVATHQVDEFLQNADVTKLRINAEGLTDIPLGSFTYNISLGDLDLLKAWNALSGTPGYEKMTTTLPNTATIRPEGANVRIQDKTAFMQRLEWLSNFTRLAPQSASAYFATNSIIDTTMSYRFVPDTINMTGNLNNLDVVDNAIMNISDKQCVLNIPQNGVRYNVSCETLDKIALPQSYLNVWNYNIYGAGDLPTPADQDTRKFKTANHFGINNIYGNHIQYGYVLNGVLAGNGVSSVAHTANSTNSIHFSSNSITISAPNPWPSGAITPDGTRAVSFDRLRFFPTSLTIDPNNYIIDFGNDSVCFAVPQYMINDFGIDATNYTEMLSELGIYFSSPIKKHVISTAIIKSL